MNNHTIMHTRTTHTHTRTFITSPLTCKLGLRKHEQSHHHDTRTRTFITSRLTCKLGLREDKRPVSVLMFSEPCTRLLLSTWIRVDRAYYEAHPINLFICWLYLMLQWHNEVIQQCVYSLCFRERLDGKRCFSKDTQGKLMLMLEDKIRCISKSTGKDDKKWCRQVKIWLKKRNMCKRA